MTRETQSEMGAFLAEHLDAIQPDLARMAAPYEAATEYRRRVDIASRYVADMDCECHRTFGECPKCFLTRVLEGDE